jgi:hypothetical protein
VKRLLVATAALVVAMGVIFGVVVAQPSDPDCAKWDPAGGPTHFNHKCHHGRANAKGVKVDTQDSAKCKDCHAISDKGAVLAPAQQGHAPCMQSKCHSTEFLGAPLNAEMEKKTPPRTKSFCAGCHPSTPWAWKKPQVSINATWHNQRDHHLEMGNSAGEGMDHYKHTQLKKKDGKQIGCRDCHVVDDTTWAFKQGSPGHGQCLSCHSAEGQAFPLSECGSCHKDGSRRSWLLSLGVKIDPTKDVETRPGSRVRSCGSEGHTRYVQKDLKPGKGVPCFKHETQQHRTKKDGNDVQCAQCHYVVTDKSRWGSRTFNSLADLHKGSIIHANPNDDAEKHHQACATAGCHAGQTRLGSGLCQKCHADL